MYGWEAHMPRCASGGQLSGVSSFLPRIEFRPTGFSCKDFYLLSHLAGPRQFYLFFSNLFTVLLLQWLEPRRECCIKIAKVYSLLSMFRRKALSPASSTKHAAALPRSLFSGAELPSGLLSHFEWVGLSRALK